MNELSLFSGAGGGLLATKHLLGWTTIGYVENSEYCQEVLLQRIKDGFLDPAPIFGDIREFISEGYAEAYQGMVDVITAGFPCQPFSVAGKQKGADDERNMWPATRDAIRIIRPRYALLENVPGLLASGYFNRILSDLSQIGYDARWTVLGAHHVGAPHKRDRLWVLAYPKPTRRWAYDSQGCQLEGADSSLQQNGQKDSGRLGVGGQNVADTTKPNDRSCDSLSIDRQIQQFGKCNGTAIMAHSNGNGTGK